MSKKALWLFLAVGLAWGVPYFWIRIAVTDFHPASIVFARVLIGSLLLVPIAIRSGAFKQALRHWPWVLFFAVAEMIVPWWLITNAEQHISSGLAGLLIATVPFFATPMSYFLGDKSVLHPKNLLGLAIGFGGVFALVGIDSLSGHLDPVWVLAMAVAAFGYALAPIGTLHKIPQVPTVGVISLSMLMVTVVYAVPAAATLPADLAAVPSIDAWIALAGLGVVCSALAFLLFFELTREIGGARATLITYLNTAVAIVLGVLFLKEPITTGMLIGFPAVIVGSWLASRKH